MAFSRNGFRGKPSRRLVKEALKLFGRRLALPPFRGGSIAKRTMRDRPAQRKSPDRVRSGRRDPDRIAAIAAKKCQTICTHGMTAVVDVGIAPLRTGDGEPAERRDAARFCGDR